MSIIIRKEKPGDIPGIHDITVAAFQNAQYSEHNEQFIVAALRKLGGLSISLVAEADVIVGHVAVSPVEISDGSQDWYGLGPISVVPDMQNRGIGSLLMNAAIAELNSINANGCVLLGEPDYYSRFGFKALDGLILPGVPPEYFQALLIQGSLLQGSVSYHEAFSATA